METLIPKIPTAEEIAAMTPEEKEAARIALESAMVAEAEHYRRNEEKRVEVQAKADAANSAFLDANKALFDELTEAKTEAKISHELLQSAAVARRLLSGDKSWEAFQAAETWETRYDESALFNWIITEAPLNLRRRMLKLDTKKADEWLTDRVEENGVVRRLEGTPDVPAVCVKSYTGKVMSQQLDAMIARLKPVSPPKMIAAVSDPVSIYPLDSIRLLTQDEVKAGQAEPVSELDVLLSKDAAELIRVAAIKPSDAPTPVESMPPVITGDIPF